MSGYSFTLRNAPSLLLVQPRISIVSEPKIGFRNRLVRSIAKSDLGVIVHVVRRRHFEYPDGTFPNRFCAQLDAAWRRKHEQAEQYVNEIYLSLVKFPYKAGVLVGAKDRLAYLTHRRHRERRDYWRRRCAQELRDATQRVLQTLAGYEPKLLGMYSKADGWYSEPLAFLNYLVNWEDGEVRVPRMSIRDYLGRNRRVSGASDPLRPASGRQALRA